MKETHVILQTGRNELSYIKIDDILYLKADGNYTHIKLKTEEVLTVCKNLKCIKNNINSSFFVKINRSIVINQLHVRKMKLGTSPIVILSNKEKFKPSRRLQNSLKLKFAHTVRATVHTAR